MKFHAISVAAASALGLAVPNIWAQGVPLATLPDTVVTATRTPVPLTDVLADVTLIDRAQIERAGQTSLLGLLATQPGVQIGQNGGLASVSSVFLRGARANQTVVLIDGVRVNSATSGQTSLENIPLAQVERIEILRGAASSLYGADAVGGVIQIITRKADGASAPRASANVGLGSDGQRQVGASVRGGTEMFSYSLGVETARAVGFNAIATPANTSFNVDRDGYVRENLSLNLAFRPVSGHELGLSVLDSRQRYQFDGAPTNNAPLSTAGTTARDYDAVNDGRLNSWNLRWQARWLPNWRTTLTFGRGKDNTTSLYTRYSTGASINPGRFDTTSSYASLQSDLSLGPDVLTLLFEDRTEAVSSTTVYAVRERSIRSSVLSYALNRGPFQALATVRQDNNSQFGLASTHAVSLGYKLAPQWRVVASYGSSFQAPTFNQLYFPGSGNARLTPQTSQNTEVGLRYEAGDTQASLTAYRNDVKGFINPVNNTQSSLAVLEGWTLAARTRWGSTRLSASLDYTDAFDKSANPQVRLVRVARTVLNLRAEQPLGAGLVFGELQRVGDREDSPVPFVANQRVSLPAFTLVNLGVQWPLARDWRLLARINNVGDERYQLANSFAMPGRNLFVGLSWAP
jgi:vitamin B12 transporter